MLVRHRGRVWHPPASLASVFGGGIGEAPIVKTEGQWHTKGSYGAFAAMWYKWIDVDFDEGEDYTCSIAIRPSTFPGNTTIVWDVPDTPPAMTGGVYGYLTIQYGNYDDSPVETPITPRQVYTISDLTVNGSWTFDTAGDSSILQECWLTASSTQTGSMESGTKVKEVGFFPHVSADTAQFVAGLAQLGVFTDPGGRQWNVATTADSVPFYMVTPANGLDIQPPYYWTELFTFLVNKGALTGLEWFNGMAIGVEPRLDGGTMTVPSLSVSYAGAARVPWTITDLNAAATSATTALLTFSPAAGATSHQYRINGGSWVSMPGDSIVTGLTGSTQYQFEVRGVNATGNAAASNVSTTTTFSAVGNILANGTFTVEAPWLYFNEAGKSVSGGKAVFSSTPEYNAIVHPSVPFTAGKYYDVSFELVISAGWIRMDWVGGTTRSSGLYNTSGTKTFRMLANASNNQVHFLPIDTVTCTIDNVTVTGPYDTP